MERFPYIYWYQYFSLFFLDKSKAKAAAASEPEESAAAEPTAKPSRASSPSGRRRFNGKNETPAASTQEEISAPAPARTGGRGRFRN